MTWNRAGWSFLRRWAVLLLRRWVRCTWQESSGFVNEESLQMTILKVTVTVNKNHDNSLTHWTLGTRYFQTCVSLCVPCWTYPHRRSLVEESQHATSLFVGCTATYSLWWVLDAIYTHMFTVYIHYITLHYITLHHITLHYIRLHYITLHTYIH